MQKVEKILFFWETNQRFVFEDLCYCVTVYSRFCSWLCLLTRCALIPWSQLQAFVHLSYQSSVSVICTKLVHFTCKTVCFSADKYLYSALRCVQNCNPYLACIAWFTCANHKAIDMVISRFYYISKFLHFILDSVLY